MAGARLDPRLWGGLGRYDRVKRKIPQAGRNQADGGDRWTVEKQKVKAQGWTMK